MFFSFLTISTPVLAESVVHIMGTTGYMLREAMHAGAQKHSPDLYQQALLKQKEAKKYHRNRSFKQAHELTLQSYDLAKQARDQSLQITGKKFADYR